MTPWRKMASRPRVQEPKTVMDVDFLFDFPFDLLSWLGIYSDGIGIHMGTMDVVQNHCRCIDVKGHGEGV